MDCHVFRRLCDELAPALMGSRIEKIHQPAPDVTMFTFYGGGRKRFLFLKSGRKAPFLFLSSHKVPSASAPPATTMRLRKYLADRRVVDSFVNWPSRRLCLRVASDSELWLILDLREGPSLLFGSPAEQAPFLWPDPKCWETLCMGAGWRDWPVLTPPLRRTLPLLPPGEQAALLLDLEAGGGDLFVYEDADGNRAISAWPLPPEQRLGREELVVEDPIRACAAVGEVQVLRGMASRFRTEAARPHLAEASRLRRLLLKLEAERERLGDMQSDQETARLLQANLYKFFPDEKRSRISLDTEEGLREIELDPRLTIRENMAALFHRAGRGKRGLALLEGRFSAVRKELARAEQAGLTAQAAVSAPAPSIPSCQERTTQTPALPKNIQPFRSTDGFLLLRGRDAKGNAQMLKLAAPHDLWLHTGGGPGAHVLIRRDHAAQEIPRTTLAEAAMLAVLKSWRKDETQVDVLVALTKFVHPIRGAKPGTVRIDRFETTILVSPDPETENRLALRA